MNFGGSTQVNYIDNDSVKYFWSKKDHADISNQDAGTSNLTNDDRTLDEKNAVKYPKISRAENCECDVRAIANYLAQFSGPDLT